MVDALSRNRPQAETFEHRLGDIGDASRDPAVLDQARLVQCLGVVRFGHPVSKKSGPPGGPTLKT